MKKNSEIKKKIAKKVERIVLIMFLISTFFAVRSFIMSSVNSSQTENSTQTYLEKKIDQNKSLVKDLLDEVLKIISFVALMFAEFFLVYFCIFLVKKIQFLIHLIAKPIVYLLIFLGNKLGYLEDLQESVETELASPLSEKMLEIARKIFPEKVVKDTFEPLVSDWNYEVFEKLKIDKNAKTEPLDKYYFIKFILTMLQKSPVGDLLEFIKKIAS